MIKERSDTKFIQRISFSHRKNIVVQKARNGKVQAGQIVDAAVACGNCNFPIAYINVVSEREGVCSHFFSRRLAGRVRFKVFERTECSVCRNFSVSYV